MRYIKNFFTEFGAYLLLMKEAFRKPQNFHVFYRKLLFEMKVLGLDSILIVTIISVFVGAAVVIQLLLNLQNPIYPDWVYGYASRKAIMLEFSPTIISLILAGKCASRITSELGSQRISEQIDALEVMGVNTASYLILPKIIASMIFFPLLIILSIFIALLGGAVGAISIGSLTMTAYIEGLRLEYGNIDMIFAIVKTFVNAIIISTIASYRGYTLKGGSVEVGIQSTNAVVQISIVIMIFDLVITNLFM